MYDRILRQATHDDDGRQVGALPTAFGAADVRATAQDTCRNWFVKVNSVKQLLPRLYMELALLRCYRFLQDGPPLDALCRLCRAARGVAHPVAASYLRCFIARKAAACGVDPIHVVPLLADAVRAAGPLLAPAPAASASSLRRAAGADAADAESARTVIAPALAWIARCASRSSASANADGGSPGGLALRERHGASAAAAWLHVPRAERLEALLGWAEGRGLSWHADNDTRVWGDARPPAAAPAPPPVPLLALPGVIAAMEPADAMAHAKRLAKLVKASGAASGIDSGLQMEHALAAAYAALGARVSAADEDDADAPAAAEAIEHAAAAFRACMKVAARFAALAPHLRTVAAWAGFAARRLPAADVERVLRGVADRVAEHASAAPAAGGSPEADASAPTLSHAEALALSEIYRAAVDGAAAQRGPAGVLAVAAEGSLGALADVLPAGEARTQAAGALLDAALPHLKLGSSGGRCSGNSDPVALSVLFESARIVHDAIDAMTPPSELRQSNDRLARLVRTARFPGDLDASNELAFLARCRGAFGRCHGALEAVVHRAATALHRLAATGGSQRKRRDQMLALAAFLEVTLVSLRDPVSRARAALLASLGCHAAGLASRADACMELALAVVKEESARAAALVAGSADLMDGEDASALRAACDATVLGFAESAGGVFAALRLDVEADPLHLIARACRLVTEHPWVLPADGLLRAARPIASALPALCQDLPPGPSRTINLLAREEAFCKDVHALYTGVLASCTAVVEAHAASVPVRATPARHAAALALGAALHLGGEAAREHVAGLTAEAHAHLPADERKRFVAAAKAAGL